MNRQLVAVSAIIAKIGFSALTGPHRGAGKCGNLAIPNQIMAQMGERTDVIRS